MAALAIAVAALAKTVGGLVVALDTYPARSYERFSTWDRLRLVGLRTADLDVIIAGGIALALALLLRVLFRWPAGTPSEAARAVVVTVLVMAVWQVFARTLFLVGITADNTSGWLGVFTGYQQAEAALATVGEGFGAVVLFYLGVRGLGVLRARGHAPPEPLGVADVDAEVP